MVRDVNLMNGLTVSPPTNGGRGVNEMQLRPSRPTALPDAGSRYFEPEIETMPRGDLEALQERRVLELIPTVYENSPFYRQLWSAAGVGPGDIRNLGDFRRLIPTWTK